jgi:hypothetical protein
LDRQQMQEPICERGSRSKLLKEHLANS